MRKLTLGLLAIILLFTSCSTKKNTFTRRLYHNLTSHYNIYWNGREAFREGVKNFNSSLKDDYNFIIPVYNYGDESNAQSIFANMDRAIEKSSLCIQKHSIYKNNKEHIKWIDDCYFLIGKSYFYKHEYISARRTFGFVQREYKDNPIKYDATLWLAKTYICQEQYEKALIQMNNLLVARNNSNFPNHIKQEINLNFADLYVKQKKYEEAIPYLNKALRYSLSKDITARVYFILAQIYQETGNLEKAGENYSACIKKRPPYEMEFQAQISRAQSFQTQNADGKGLVRALKKMLKESKNKSFRDQIYYALSDVAFAEKQDSVGKHYLARSVATSLENKYQKTKSSLRLGEIYFDESKYSLAQAYYDTASQNIPDMYPNYKAIMAKAEVLSELVLDVETIYSQDSLQRVAKLPEEERLTFINDLIDKYIEEEENKKDEEWGDQLAMLNGEGPSFGEGENAGNWYFYNTSLISKGMADFGTKWGDRKYGDLWRLSDKLEVNTEELEATPSDSTSVQNDSLQMLATDPHKVEYYLKSLPLTPEKLIVSDSLLVEAFNNLGFLYYQGLKDYPNAAKTYVDFLERFPENKYNLAAYYALYKIKLAQKEDEEAEKYKQIILTQFPNSNYAMVIQDPEYYKKLNAEKSAAGNFYTKVYKAWSKEQYYRVIDYANEAETQFENDSLYFPRIEYLKALSIGKVDVQDSMMVVLNHLVERFPQSEVSALATNIINYNENGTVEEVEKEEGPVDLELIKADSLYSYDPNAKFYVGIVVANSNVNINALKIKIADFNKKFYRTREFKVQSILLNNQFTFISIRAFETAQPALSYRDNIDNSEYVFSAVLKEDYFTFIISQENYPILYNEKNIGGYLKFFEQKFISNK
ncbi:MAG: tetratricopeptide repeat protein [Bacteroidales bacterium]